jgi:hypothetical protein
MRFSLLAVLLVCIVLLTAQAQDMIMVIGESLVAGQYDSGLTLIVATTTFGFYVWYWARQANHLRYAEERDIMVRYRTQFPAASDENKSEDERKRRANQRVEMILWYRSWMPSVTGFLSFLTVAGAVGLAAVRVHGSAVRQSLTLLALVILIVGLVIMLSAWRRRVVEMATRSFGKTVPAAPVRDEEPMLDWAGLPVSTRWLLNILAIAYIAVAITLVVAPGSFNGSILGSTLVFFTAACGIVVIGTFFAMAARRSNLPIITTLVVVVTVLTHVFDHHRTALLENDEDNPATHRPTATDAFTAWFATVAWPELPAQSRSNLTPQSYCLSENAADDIVIPAAERVPLILVATAGGGSRAAYWTATVLGHLHKAIPDFSNHLFAISGVSGGSLGAASYVSLLAAERASPRRGRDLGRIAQNALQPDFLGPALAAMVSGDVLHSLTLGLAFKEDRGRAIERAWEDGWHTAATKAGLPANGFSDPFLALWSDNRPWPALLLNGTVVETGERIVISNLRLQDSRSFTGIDFHWIVGKDVLVSTAANVSARFPYVGPAALVVPQDGMQERIEKFRIVDGGYYDNFGATTLREILEEVRGALRRCADLITPVILQVSSDPQIDPRFYVGTSAVGSNSAEPKVSALGFMAQFRAPIVAYMNTRSAHGLRAVRDLEAEAKRNGGLFHHITLCAEYSAGSDRGPPLGWALSNSSRKQIVDQLTCPRNSTQLSEIVRLFGAFEISD